MKVSNKIIKFLEDSNSLKNYLLWTNIFLVAIAIALCNVGLLPFSNVGDFAFVVFIILLFALYRPGWAFLFFIGFSIVEIVNLAPEELEIMLRPYQIVGALGIVALGTRFISKKINFSLPKLLWTDWSIIIFSLSGFIAALFATSSSLALKQSVIIFSFALLYFFSRIFIQNLKDVKKIIPFFLSSSAIVLIYSIWQNVRFLNGKSHFEVMPGRPNGSFSEADWLGIFVVFLLSILYTIAYSFYKKINIEELRYQVKDLVRASFIWLMIILTHAVLVITMSRSAWLGGLFVLTACIFFILKDRAYPILGMLFSSLLLGVGIVYIFGLTNFELRNRLQSTGSGKEEITISCKSEMGVPAYVENISELTNYGCKHINLEEIDAEKSAGNTVAKIYRNDPNISIRSEVYKKSWEEIKKSPILGIGWGNISDILGRDARGAGLNSSNIFLEIWLGAGIMGLFAILFILGKIIYNTLKSRGDWQLFLALSFLAIIIPNLFNAGIMMGFIWVWLAITQIKD